MNVTQRETILTESAVLNFIFYMLHLINKSVDKHLTSLMSLPYAKNCCGIRTTFLDTKIIIIINNIEYINHGFFKVFNAATIYHT